jgi:MFS family permease
VKISSPQPEVYKVGTLTYTWRSLVLLFAWLLWGDFCWTMMEAVVPSIMPLKLRSLDSPNVLIGLVLSTLPATLNLTVTPILSFKSDRHRGPLGRRTPFILYTIPFLCLSMVLIGYSDSIAQWINHSFLGGNAAQQAKVSIILLAVFVALFDFFNMFVFTVYWYLFADVVPEALIGRFMGWFRLVGVIAGFVYNFFVFPYAMSHMREIYLGGALLYFLGFGVVCLRVREGQYPPPPVETKRTTLMDRFRTYARECYKLRHYWDINLTYAFTAMAGCAGVYSIFFLQSLGLDLKVIGRTGAMASVVLPIALLFAGAFVDRWNAVRVSAYIGAVASFMAFGNWVWLFVTQSPSSTLYLYIAIGAAIFTSLATAISQLLEMPRLIALFPREKFGQFCGAIALVRGPAGILGGVLAGAFMDLWVRFVFPKEQYGLYGYRFMFLWTATFTLLSFYFQYRTYRAWKRLGGEAGYTPPTVGYRLRDLPPRAEDRGTLKWGLILIQAISALGTVLSGFAWWVYYSRHTTDTVAANAFLVSWILNIVLFIFAVRFIKYMERP